MTDIKNGLETLSPNAPLVDPELGVDIWQYRNFGERAYVANLCAIDDALVAGWRGHYGVDARALCWARYVLPSDFRYQRRAGMDYWDSQIREERKAMSVLGRFMPYHMRCMFELTEAARGRMGVRIHEIYSRLAMPHGFRFELEPIWSYKASVFVDDRDTGLWTVVYTERCLLYTSPSPRDQRGSRMPSSA